MTQLAKVLVFVGLTLSLIMAGLALGVYTNRIDWPGTGTAGTGEVKKKKDEVDRWKGLGDTAAARWHDSATALVAAETRRAANHKWYGEQMTVLEGQDEKGNTVAGPVKLIVYENRRLKLKDGLPELAPAKDLAARVALLAELAKTQEQIEREIATIGKLQKQEAELTLEINGEDKAHGLRDLIAEEEKAREHSVAELEYLIPLRVTRDLEKEVLMQRRKALEARVGELKKASGVATRRP